MSASPRNYGLDAGRLVVGLTVVLIHASKDIWNPRGELPVLALQLCSRWGVAFFFLSSGYFSTRYFSSVRSTAEYAVDRLLPLAASWILIYAFLFGGFDVNVFQFKGEPVHEIYHLWFLPSLAVCLLLFSILRNAFGTAAALAVGIALYLVALAFGPYAPIIFHRDFKPIWDTRNGPFFGGMFVMLGVWFREHPSSYRFELPLNIGLVAVGTAITACEMLSLEAYRERIDQHDFLFGTVLVAVGMFNLFRRLSNNAVTTAVGRFGVYAFGIYAGHVAVMHFLTRDIPLRSFSESLVVGVETFVITLALIWVAARVPPLRRFLV